MSKKGSQGNPFTGADGDVARGFQFCRCSECGKVSECTPDHDFYYFADSTLRCEPCVTRGCDVVTVSASPDPSKEN